MNKSIDELKILFPEEDVLTSQGKLIFIPFKAKYLNKGVDIFSRYIESFVDSGKNSEFIYRLFYDIKFDNEGKIASKTFKNISDQVLRDVKELTIFSSKIEISQDFDFGELAVVELIAIIKKIFEINEDFLSQVMGGKKESEEELGKSKAGENL